MTGPGPHRPGGPADDTELVARARAGDTSALDLMFRRYGPQVHSFVQQQVGDRRAADGLTRDAFTAAGHRIGMLADATRLRPWLLAIAARHAYAALRGRPFHSARAADAGLPAAAAGLEDAVAAADRLDALLAAVHRRPAADRRAVLSFLDGAPEADLARAYAPGPQAGRHAAPSPPAGACRRLHRHAADWYATPSADARAAVVAHLRRCPRCTLAGRLTRPGALLPLLVVSSLPADLAGPVLAELGPGGAGPRRAPRGRHGVSPALLGLLAAAVAVAAVAVVTLGGGPVGGSARPGPGPDAGPWLLPAPTGAPSAGAAPSARAVPPAAAVPPAGAVPPAAAVPPAGAGPSRTGAPRPPASPAPPGTTAAGPATAAPSGPPDPPAGGRPRACPTGSGPVTTDGAVRRVAAPATVPSGDEDDRVHLFAERAGVPVDRPLPLDVAAPGTYRRAVPAATPAVPAGTCVSSHYLYRSGDAPGPQAVRVTFPEPVLGLAARWDRLRATDVLGRGGTRYPSGGASGSWTGHVETIALSADRRTLRVRLGAGGDVSALRVVTSSGPARPPSATG